MTLAEIDAKLVVLEAAKAEKELIDSKLRLRDFTGHPKALAFIHSKAKRKVARAGRRGAKTVAVATMDVEDFVAGHRVLYTAPTKEQTDTYWREVNRALAELIDMGIYVKNETERYIERPGTENRLKAKTIWNVDSARGDYADKLSMDEYQLMDEYAWASVLQPMLADHDGDARFIYTPPSLRIGGVSKAHDPLHAPKLFKTAQADQSGLWETFHWTSRDNPFVSEVGLSRLTEGMSSVAYRQEIEAEDDELSPARLIYRAFNESVCLISPFEIPEKWPRYVGHDFGGANPAALFFAQDPATGYFYAYHEYFPGGGLSTYEHVKAFKDLTAGATVLKRAGGSHQEDEIRQGYTAQGWPIQEPKILNVNARIDRVRGIMEKNQLFVFSNLIRVREELMTYLWKSDVEGIITDEILNKSAFHMMDSMAYILSDFTPERVGQTVQTAVMPSFA